MFGPLARASSPDKLPRTMGMKTSPSKRTSPPSRASRLKGVLIWRRASPPRRASPLL